MVKHPLHYHHLGSINLSDQRRGRRSRNRARCEDCLCTSLDWPPGPRSTNASQCGPMMDVVTHLALNRYGVCNGGHCPGLPAS
jgi:hypothetical protein